MSDVAALIADLVRAGVDPDLIGRTAATIASAATNAPAQRTAGAIRQERYRRETEAKRLADKDWYPLVGKVIARDGGKCAYCGTEEKLGADHVLPLSRGGTNDISNLVACCEACNKSKGGRTVEEWRSGSSPRHGRVTVTGSDVCDDLPSPEGSSPTPPSPKPLPSIPPSPPKGGSSPADFDQFWSIYPNKVGKRDAEKAFSKAVKRADISIILAGLKAYVAKTDDRPWCNPATWLNQDRWEDRPATPPPRLPAYPPEPRNVGELTILEAKRGDIFDAPFRSPRLDDESDRNAGFAGTGIARRIALAAAGRS